MRSNQYDIGRKKTAFSLQGEILNHPEEEIKQLEEALEMYSESLELPMRHKLLKKHNNENVCYILKKGYFSFQQHTSDKIISYVYPPLIIGLGEIFTHCSVGYLYTETSAIVRRVTTSNLLHCLEENPYLWRNIVVILSYTIQRVFILNSQISAKDTYQIVRNFLMDLNEQPDEIKNSVSVSRYILERSHISKSMVMRILSELRKGNHISVNKNGKLSSINNLPNKF